MDSSIDTSRSIGTTVRSVASGVTLLVAVLLIAIGGVTVWLKTQVLDTDAWVETSQETIQEPEVRDALATWAVDQVFDRTDPAGALAELLPPRAAPLAGPLVSRLREEAYGVANQALEEPKVEEAWVAANRRAHERFVGIIEGRDPIYIETSSGMRLDLRPLLERVASRIGVDPDVVDRLPLDRVIVTPERSPEVERAIKALRALDEWGGLITYLALPFLALGIWLSRNRRRAWMLTGLGTVLAAFAVARASTELGPFVAELLTESSTWQSAVIETWFNVIQGLEDATAALAIVGVATIVLAWATTPTGVPQRMRRAAAPLLVDRLPLAVLGMGVLAIVFIGMVHALESRRLFVQVLLVIGVGATTWVLGRQTRHELEVAPVAASEPDATTDADDER